MAEEIPACSHWGLARCGAPRQHPPMPPLLMEDKIDMTGGATPFSTAYSKQELVQAQRAPDSGAVSQILSSVLRQEAAFRSFAEEQAAFRNSVQKDAADFREKIENIQTQHTALHEHLTGGSPKRAMSFGSSHSEHREVEPKLTEIPKAESTLAKAKAVKQKAAERKERDSSNALSEVGHMEEELHWLLNANRRIVLNYKFEICGAIVIVLNVLLMALHLQWKGYNSAKHLGLRSDDNGYSSSERAFEIAELMFNAVYLIELCMRVTALKRRFFQQAFNLLDAFIVLVTCAETMILKPLESKAGIINLSSLRVMRFFRIFRISRIMNMTEHMGEIRVLIQTLVMSMRGLVWSVVLVVGIILASAIIMVQLTESFMNDESFSPEIREWLFNNFGSTARSFYTMFECTFTGRWYHYARTLIYEVHGGFCVFFLPYVIYVNFAVMRVIAALFLKQTMSVAALDDAKQAQRLSAEKARFATELKDIFIKADSSNNGCVDREEFDQMLCDEEVINHLEKMNLEIEEAIALFSVLSSDDGEADYEEFLVGALKMKSTARTIDTVQVVHQVIMMRKEMDVLAAALNCRAGGTSK